MPISLTPTPALEFDAAELASVVADAVGAPVTAVKRVGGGRNSRVFHVTCGPAGQFAVKRYLDAPGEWRRRLDTEFTSLEFLWSCGLRRIPQPIAADRARGVGVYRWVEGSAITPGEIGETEIDDASEWLAALKALRDRPGAERLPAASEACFSVRAILDNVDWRLQRLAGAGANAPAREALRAFLHEELLPARQQIARWAIAHWAAAGGAPEDKTPIAFRTLSPSDFGFHNGRRTADGRIVYLDFEYFGWDDPAKTLADFILHPAMALPAALAQRFTGRMSELFGEDPRWRVRAEVVYPLFGLKWCVILLNEFVPSDLHRRGFAGVAAGEIGRVQLDQLAEARRMLQRIVSADEQFPIGPTTN